LHPLRILHVTPYSAHAWAYGGVPRVVDELSRGLVERGHRVTVCTTDAYDDRHRLGRTPNGVASGVALEVFPNLSNTAAYHLQLFFPLGLSRWLNVHARQFDVAHIHACRNLPGTIAARHLRRAGVPIILSPHGTARRFERRIWAKWIFDLTIGRRMFDAELVLAVSSTERDELAALGLPAERLAVLENPVDAASVEIPRRGDFRARHGLPWPELVLFLGKLTPGKHVDELVRAFALLNRPGAGLVIAGNDMGAGPSLRRLVDRMALADRTRFVGLLTGRARLEALADADVVAYPARPEAFGLVPMEALQCGTPVVVSADSGCGALVSDLGGGLVAGNDPSALAQALRQVLDDRPRFAAAALRAGERVRARFARSRICADLEQHYRALAKTAALKR
jgi:glycosyltransferase involved in cell wall biosynthesis